MQEPTVSVIVTTYNREGYLKETILSILSQTYTDYELIVVDNFSNYDFFKVMETFGDSRIRPFQNANNGIIAVNRNYGISKAKGKYLAFCDDDDLWMPEKLEKQMKVMMDKGVGVVYTDALLFSDNPNIHTPFCKYSIKSYKDLVKNNPVILSTTLIKRDENIHFNEYDSFIAVEDHYLWLELFFKGISFCHVNIPLIYYRRSPSGNYEQNKRKRYLQYILVLVNIMIQYPQKCYIYYFARIINLMMRYTARSLTK